MATVTLVDVSKVFDNGFHAIHDLSLDIAESEFLVLVGPSGSGKSTALRMVAGLESITSGEIRIGDKVVNDVQPKDRDIAMVFQNYALYPAHDGVQQHRYRHDLPTNVFSSAPSSGSPSMNLYDGTLTFGGDAGSIQIGSQTIAIPM